jgi:hypothetical protein
MLEQKNGKTIVNNNYPIKSIINILGIEKENIKNYNTRQLKKEFNSLLKKHYNSTQIWLKEDYGVYGVGKILDKTYYLVAIKN